MRRFLFIAMTGLLAACAQQSHVQLYAGEARSAEQIVTLLVPSELEIQSINGQRYSAANAMFGANDKELHLQPGAYRIHAFYKNGFDLDGGISHEVVRGRTGIFQFEAQAGERWALDFERPNNLQEARKLQDEFLAWAENTATGARLDAQLGGQNTSLLSVLSSTTERPLEPASVAPLGQANHVTLQPAALPNAGLPHSEATLQTLQQMWNLLTPQSRAAFLSWAQP